MWLVASLAFAKPRPVESVADPGCPVGTAPAGAVPPKGDGVWCERWRPGGPVREGPYLQFYPNGALRAQGAYADGEEHGVWTFLHPGGNVESTGQMVMGARFGEWKTYYTNGQLASAGAYLAGDRHGRWELLSEDGTRREVGEFVKGLQYGTWIEYGFDRPIREREYRDGRLLTVRDL